MESLDIIDVTNHKGFANAQEIIRAYPEQAWKLIKDLEARLEDFQWISVKDKLPEDAGRFLTSTIVGMVSIKCFSLDIQWHNNGKDPYYWNMHITHWMPLPERPKD